MSSVSSVSNSQITGTPPCSSICCLNVEHLRVACCLQIIIVDQKASYCFQHSSAIQWSDCSVRTLDYHRAGFFQDAISIPHVLQGPDGFSADCTMYLLVRQMQMHTHSEQQKRKERRWAERDS